MSRSRRVAFAPAFLRTSVRLCAAGALAVACGGCASKQAQHDPSRVAGPVASADDRHWRVEIEEDGLPAQLAPRQRRPTADDPREPWSPNYGAAPAAPDAPVAPASAPLPPAPKAGARPAPASPAVVPPPPRGRVAAGPAAARTAAFDEDALIRRAIAEHEMRRRD